MKVDLDELIRRLNELSSDVLDTVGEVEAWYMTNRLYWEVDRIRSIHLGQLREKKEKELPTK